MTIVIKLEPDVLATLNAEAKAQGRDVASVAADALRQRFSYAKNESNTAAEPPRTLYEAMKQVLGPEWPGPGGDSRMSEVEAACDPLPNETQ